MKKRQIAVLLSLLFAVPAGMVAIAQSESASTEAVVEVQPTSSEPVAVVQEVTVVTDQNAEPVMVAEATTAVYPAEVTVAVRPKQMSTTEWMKMNNEFRQDIDDQIRLLPRQATYFDRQESRLGMISQNSAFPRDDSREQFQPTQAQISFFDRKEQQLIASLQPQQPRIAASSDSGQTAQLAMSDTQQKSGE